MKYSFTCFAIIGALLILPTVTMASGTSTSMILKTDFQIWEINPSKLDFYSDYEKTDFVGMDVSLIDEDWATASSLVKKETVQGLDSVKIRNYLSSVIAPAIFREKTDVTLNMDKDGKVTFEGTGLYGRQLDLETATKMVEFALSQGLTYVNLPLIKEDPVVNVQSEELKKLGIKELISGGETDFSNSPRNRIININNGLSKFIGHIVKPGEEFVFGNVLGPVEASTGYLQELVIKGDKTLPEYGGGLCQVSTTAYRAALAAGFPVTSRRNHSYAVSYYKPLGLDATVYPPSVDMKFMNDTANSFLIQSFTIGSKAYYNFYGTKTNRTVRMIGPYYSAWSSPPAQKVEYSTNMAPGQTKVVGHAVPGVNVTWYRYVTYNDEKVKDEKTGVEQNKSFLETIYSKYQARPNYFIKGAEDAVPEASQTGG